MTVVERLAEAVARGSTRRASLKAAASLAFAGLVTAAAVGRGADAARCAVRLTDDTACNPPWQRTCNGPGVGGACDGSACAGSCTLDDRYYPQGVQSACWCTALEKQAKNRYAYWKCCDCQCPGIEPRCLDADAQGNCRDPDFGCGCGERVTVAFKPAKARTR